jgi:hypothetical protein
MTEMQCGDVLAINTSPDNLDSRKSARAARPVIGHLRIWDINIAMLESSFHLFCCCIADSEIMS